jgi:hypothetical protein
MAKPPLMVELERVFNVFNRCLFGNKLRSPTIAIYLEKKVIFRYLPESDHLVVGAKFASASVEEVYESLLHEMCHIANHAEKEIDCTANQYHNSKFLDTALFVGMYVIRHKTRGWGITKFVPHIGEKARKPGAVAVHRRDEACAEADINKELFCETQKEIKRTLKIRGPKKVCFLKYECDCPPPHNSIRSGRRPTGSYPLSVKCGVCGALFRCSE